MNVKLENEGETQQFELSALNSLLGIKLSYSTRSISHLENDESENKKSLALYNAVRKVTVPRRKVCGLKAYNTGKTRICFHSCRDENTSGGT